MAINLEIIQAANSGRETGGRHNAMEMPALAFTNVTAAGATVLNAATRRVRLRNRTGGDSVYVKVQLVAGHTNAAAGTSYLLSAGQAEDFFLPKGAVGSDYEVDVRATA